MIFKFKPIHAAVFIVALSVVALWQPYWHTEVEQATIAYTGASFNTTEEALQAIRRIYPSRELENGYGYKAETSAYNVFSWYTMDSCVVSARYYGVLYENVPVTVYDETYGSYKLQLVALFLLAVCVFIAADAWRGEAAEK